MHTVALTTLGCKVNQAETEAIAGLFRQRGYRVLPFNEIADVYVINTCSVTNLGERKSRQLIRRAIRRNPVAVIAVTGCYAQINPGEILAIPGVTVVIGTQHRERLVDLVEEAAHEQRQINAVNNIMTARQFEDIPLCGAYNHTRAYLKIQEGCNSFCSYCIIPYTRGPLRSRPLPSIVEETRRLVTQGFKEIVLTGIHLGAYGMEQGVTLAHAVQAILTVPGVMRLRLGSLESAEVSTELLALLHRERRLCRHLHLPLQAGNDEILQRMNRPYTCADYRRLVEDIIRQIPDVAISTDIIAGFPGETEAHFSSSLAFIDTLPFARLHIFPFSPRTGTPAASFPGQVPEEEKHRRVAALLRLARRKEQDYISTFCGRRAEVLFETVKDGLIEGYTGNYLKVYCSPTVAAGEIHPVQLQKQWRDGLRGKIMA